MAAEAKARGAYEVVYADDNQVVLAIENLMITYAIAEPVPACLPSLTAAFERIGRRFPGKIVVLVVIQADARPPSEAAKKVISKIYENQKDVCGMATIVEGEGFVAAAKRGALSFLQLMSRLPYPTTTKSTVAEGLTWARSKLGTNLPPDNSIHAAVQYCREQF